MNVKLMGKLRQQICLKTKKTRKSKLNNKITALIPKERLICIFLASVFGILFVDVLNYMYIPMPVCLYIKFEMKASYLKMHTI